MWIAQAKGDERVVTCTHKDDETVELQVWPKMNSRDPLITVPLSREEAHDLILAVQDGLAGRN